MEKPAQTPNGAPHRRRRRRPAGNGSAPQAPQPAREGKAPAQPREPRKAAPQNTAATAPKPPREGGAPRSGRPRRGQGRPNTAAQPQQPPKQAAPAPRQPAPQAKPAAPQPPRRGNSRSASAIPSAPLRDQPKAPRPQRSRVQHSAVPNEPGLDLISRRPPKQKFANFEDYLAAHGGMTVPLPPEAADAPKAEKPVPATEATE